jgi:hypothetical protein
LKIDNESSFRLKVYSNRINTILNYEIIREEGVTINGAYVNKTSDFFYRINAVNGQIERTSNLIKNYLSILLFVQIKDINYQAKPITCLVDFRNPTSNGLKLPRFIGSDNRIESVCEDVPLNSVIFKLNAFDPSISTRELCYSTLDNEYFKLKSEEQPSPDGSIVLKKKLEYERLLINFTALLFYCNSPYILNKQVVTVNVLNVNKHAPRINFPVRTSHLLAQYRF